MQPLAGKIEQDLFRFHTLMNANKCQSTPLWALIMSKSEHKTEKPEGREQFFYDKTYMYCQKCYIQSTRGNQNEV